jgi:hypothetical protein
VDWLVYANMSEKHAISFRAEVRSLNSEGLYRVAGEGSLIEWASQARLVGFPLMPPCIIPLSPSLSLQLSSWK